MKTIALIPARFGATRFPAKLLADLRGKPLIARTYLSTLATGVFDEVMVVTDHQSIADAVSKEGGKVFFSQKAHESGSDRIAEAAASIEADIIVNVQGDEPFQDKESLSNLVAVFEDKTVEVASLMSPIKEASQIINPNIVKVVTDKNNFSLYFSRSPIPFQRNETSSPEYFRHIGIYAYKKDLLMTFTKWEKSLLENVEMLEQLRLLENGIRIKMVPTTHQAVAIDVPEDLERALTYYDNHFSK
ncbi:3-deoxy-manno-octulosonate cytidylyltransferase [Cyclobacterium qasimii]|uniref:3-deoxy-manno-octulosonate cytidylyltransferase n=2 Tax=Cyclobacterium qasimii TaxID=1350429 RepID=S7WUP4_9BACT|nr:3-deoxy-manno-octulosonate cytidylyltransferase [Cyclobacterium qasimii]EPR67793.1 3-deoxy-manno-octulosonate cytidylyltransferase [Cyclobacterium qasimii M12-11B]GEO20383.1 3-deoxy-manno-octulosonate cytidylyltransferase [Cyclobacterium qasimii]